MDNLFPNSPLPAFAEDITAQAACLVLNSTEKFQLELVGNMLAHELGHTLGLVHSFQWNTIDDQTGKSAPNPPYAID